jgi:hypothetical protein
MNEAPANSPALELAESHPATAGERWTSARWLTVIALVFATHIALIFLFGEKKEIVPRAATYVPTLTVANNSDELLALNDPTLFALPQQRDFASASWLNISPMKPPKFSWTEPPQPLKLPSANSLGMAFGQFMQTNFFASQPLDFRPAVELSTPTLPVETAPAQNSTMQIESELAQRQLPSEISLTNWPYADVIAPSKVQVLVDAAGNVVSTVLLPPDNGFTAADYYAAADQRALELARALRFAPSSSTTFGRIIFNWHTVPPTASP